MRRLDDLLRLWDTLTDVPVTDDGALDAPFLHFVIGTPREDVWHWFEAQHPAFRVGDLQAGRRPAPEVVPH